MAKRRTASRKMKRRTHRRRSHHKRALRRTHRKLRGGVAPVSYSLSGSWPSRMSLGQGEDYERLHEGQHGGSAPYPAAISGNALITSEMEGPAMTASTLRALADVRGLRDPPFDSMAVQSAAAQKVTGGRRRRHRRGSKRHSKRRHSRRKTRRMRGGNILGFASVNSPGMLLQTQRQYDQAGLNPDYRGAAVEYKLAEARDRV